MSFDSLQKPMNIHLLIKSAKQSEGLHYAKTLDHVSLSPKRVPVMFVLSIRSLFFLTVVEILEDQQMFAGS